jgi:ribosome-binding factor A
MQEAQIHKDLNLLTQDLSASNSALDECHITQIELSPNKKKAVVFFLSPKPDEAQKSLEASASRFRRHIAQSLQTRSTPELQFKLDKGVQNAQRVDELLRTLKEQS